MDLNQEQPAPARGYRWYHKMAALLVAAISVEIGLFLIVFPWMDIWSNNYFANRTPEWRHVWMNPYFRGAVSGIGLVNLVIALAEVFGLRRFSSPDEE